MSGDEWKKQIRERYDELKKLGKSFFPYVIFKDVVVIFILFLVIVTLTVTVGANLEDVADPTDTTYNPRPEWYFLFLFQMLKFFPGSLEAIAAIVLPSVVLLFLILLPFLDRGPKRHPFDRPLLTFLGISVIIAVSWLTYAGWKSPLLNPVIEKDPNVAAGQQLYTTLRCHYCHSILGRGGVAGPDLTSVGARYDRSWLLNHFRDPKSVSPGSVMPKLNLLPEEMEQIVTYLQTLGGEGPFTSHAPVLFGEHCMTCHALDGKGENIGPDLTTVRSYRDKAYVYRYIRDPSAVSPGTAMPGFRDVLSDAEVEDLARYLISSQRGQK